MTPGEVRVFLSKYLAEKLRAQGLDLPSDFSDDSNILLLGLLDSIDFLELMSALSKYCGREIDFDELHAEQMTIVGSLCKYVSERAIKA
jgi:acyl carrier protein